MGLLLARVGDNMAGQADYEKAEKYILRSQAIL
jgi:hypothetical protein